VCLALRVEILPSPSLLVALSLVIACGGSVGRRASPSPDAPLASHDADALTAEPRLEAGLPDIDNSSGGEGDAMLASGDAEPGRDAGADASPPASNPSQDAGRDAPDAPMRDTYASDPRLTPDVPGREAGDVGPCVRITADGGPPSPDGSVVTIDPTTKYQVVEGWGTSLAWWADDIGGWGPAGRAAVIAALVDVDKGLGYNIFRYNVGGGDDPTHTHIPAHRAIPGFQPSPGVWDFTADVRQRTILLEILKKVPDAILEAASYSPPYWMTVSGCSSGSVDGQSDNLKPGMDRDFAEYLATVVERYRKDYGVTFRSVTALNEAGGDWWKAGGRQEGCHIGATRQGTELTRQEAVIAALFTALAARGLSTGQSATDDTSVNFTYSVVRWFAASTWSHIDQINTHTYSGTADARANLYRLALAKGKRLWVSESGPKPPATITLRNELDAAIYMAGVMLADLGVLHAQAWVDWQSVGGWPWGTVHIERTTETVTLGKLFYMRAGFTRFLRPGYRVIASSDLETLAALSPDGKRLVLVSRNPDAAAARQVKYDLSAFTLCLDRAVRAYRTSASENLQPVDNVRTQAPGLVLTLPAESITTVVVDL